MENLHCRNCKYDKTIIETRRSADGLKTTYYCDPKGILKHDQVTDVDKEKLLISIDQNRDTHCEYYKLKWHMALFNFFRKIQNRTGSTI